MTIKSILLSAWLTTCLVMTPSRHFQENAFCEAHASIQEVSVKGAINNHIDQQPDTFLNNYATVYFSNLNENFPINSHGTCVFTALSSVLTFFDCYVDDDYVDNGFLKSSIVDNSSSGPDKAIPYNTPSPGSTPEPLDLVIGLSETEYGDFIYQNPEHRWDRKVTQVEYDDHTALAINVGYKIPVLPWLNIIPLMGYSNETTGKTLGNSIGVDTESHSIYHDYNVEHRYNHFNYGVGLSVKPIKWLEIGGVCSASAIYGNVSVNLMKFKD